MVAVVAVRVLCAIFLNRRRRPVDDLADEPVEGVVQGTADEAVEGAMEGTVEGAMEGTAEGTADEAVEVPVKPLEPVLNLPKKLPTGPVAGPAAHWDDEA